jgi:hypothetical protein
MKFFRGDDIADASMFGKSMNEGGFLGWPNCHPNLRSARRENAGPTNGRVSRAAKS